MQYHAIPCIIDSCWRSVSLPCGQYKAIFDIIDTVNNVDIADNIGIADNIDIDDNIDDIDRVDNVDSIDNVENVVNFVNLENRDVYLWQCKANLKK